MKVTVLGAGVIGITSAYYLAKAGHEVTVVERRGGPGLETSFANAGEVSPGYASPWPAPGVPAKALRWLLMRHAPLILRPKADPEMLAWLLATLRNCTEARYRVNKSRMVRLATYSRDLLIDLRRETGIAYDAGQGGTLQLFRTARQMEGVAKDAEVLAREGVAFEVLDRAGCEAVEPGLAGSADSIAGGLRLPGDETGDCYKFTVALARRLEAMGAAFLYDTPVAGLRADNGRIRAVQTGRGDIEGDVVLACLGSYTSALLRPLGIRAPIYPVKGYSITVPVQDAGRAPVSTLLDETYKVAITRLGDRIRVGGMAEVSGFDAALPEGRRATLEHCLRSLFPGAGDPAAATFWSGLRPMTPDGPPVLGGTPIANLYVNSGHGTLGWTMACGSGRVVADLIGGAPSAIRTDDLSLARYR